MDLHQTLLSIAPHYAAFAEWLTGLCGCVVTGTIGFLLVTETPLRSRRWTGGLVFVVCLIVGGATGAFVGERISVYNYVANAEYVLKTDFSVTASFDIGPNFLGDYSPRIEPEDGQSGQSTGFAITGTIHHAAETKTVLGEQVLVPSWDEGKKSFVVSEEDAQLLQKAMLASTDPGVMAAGRRLAATR